MPTKKIESLSLPAPSVGTQRRLRVITYGDPASGPKAYLQAGLHADEGPGQVVMHHLLNLLDRADAQGRIGSRLVLVPAANPIGLAQWEKDHLSGRFDTATGVNFNRNHLDVIEEVAKAVEGSLSDDARANVALIRRAMGAALEEVQPRDEAGHLKKTLLGLAFDADVVLDLHCDFESLLHVYTGTPLWPGAADLSAQLGARVTLLASESGSDPFDEACSKIWWALARRFPKAAIPPACLAATVELRGMSDTSHELAREDAQNIYHFLARRGFIGDDAPDLPPLPREATPLRGMETVLAPSPGVVVYLKEVGQEVATGEALAEIIDPTAETEEGRVVTVRAGTSGVLLARRRDRHTRAGRSLAHVAGEKPIEGKGKELLSP